MSSTELKNKSRLVFFLLISFIGVIYAGTSITVSSQYNKEVNIKIQGSGVGGCDVILTQGQVDTSDCWCLWGTINYSFCAYTKSPVKNVIEQKPTVNEGRCPVVTGESLLCSDLSSLGNCYDHAYNCTVDSVGLCHCNTI